MNKKQIEQKAKEISENNYSVIGDWKKCEKSALDMADWLLNNQWVSVEDGLPKTSNGFSKDVLCIDNRGCLIVAKYQYGVGWWSRGGTHWNTNGFTHWMPIPKLKGGEK